MTHPIGWTGLTASERRVAELVADGLTNREVARRMFVSRHTVDYHLRQAYQRLDVSSRVELAARVFASKRIDFSMFDGVMDGVTVLEPLWGPAREIVDFRIVYANAVAADARGRSVSGLVGWRLRDAYPTNTPGPHYARVFESGVPLDLRGIEREEMVDGAPSITRFDVRVIRHGDYVIVAHRTLGTDDSLVVRLRDGRASS